MSILKVLNVGNGDCMIITPPPSLIATNRCRENEINKILIDLGPHDEGLQALSQNIDITDKVHIFLTHSHQDHIGGFDFFTNNVRQVSEITVPFYQNEIVLIAEAILNLKGMQNFTQNPMNNEEFIEEFIYLLREIVGKQMQLKQIVRTHNSPLLSFAYEDRTFDNDNIKCLNPPKIIKTFNWLRNLSSNFINNLVNELFEADFATNILNYLTNNDIQAFNDILLEENINEFRDELEAINRNKRSYIINFLVNNFRLFSEFNSDPNGITLIKIYDKLVANIHDTCIVLYANYEGKTFLLTGDTRKNVLKRLIRKHQYIHIDYLKMPHHGSIENMSLKILEKIHPYVAAIISHGNRYGHPSCKVIKMLQQMNIQIMLTNDVKKNGTTLMRKAEHLGDDFVEIS